MGNWLSIEPGLSSVDTVQIPAGQRNDNRRGEEETEGKGRNRTAVEGYIGAQPWGLEVSTESATNTETGRPVIDRQSTGAALLPSTSPSIQQYSQMGVGSGNLYQIPQLFSPTWSIDFAYGTENVTASCCPETLPTSVTAEKTPVSFADDDVVIPPSGSVDPAKIDDEDRDTVVETCSESSDEFSTALPVRQKATSTRLRKKMLPRRRDTVQRSEFFNSATKKTKVLTATNRRCST